MKKLLAILALTGLVAATASAQTYAPQQVFKSAITIPIPAQGATNQTDKVIDCRNQNSVAIQWTFQADDATTDNTSLYYRRSVDGTTFDTTATVIAVAMTGTTAKTVITNIPTWGCGYIRLAALTNAAATANITNCVVKYSFKVGAP